MITFMSTHRTCLSRRSFLKLGIGTAAAAGAKLWNNPAAREQIARAASSATVKYHLAGTDGWISLPTTATVPTYHPDPLAPAGQTTYMFGFANVTGLSDTDRQALANQAQASAPIMYFDEGQDYIIRLSNLGLIQRPDLTDPHTVHWHGFRNAIPMFDGEPTSSVSVPIGRTMDYFYRPHEAGTYMYHCHVEDTEHVQMGMTGAVYVRPAQNGNTSLYASGKYAYNDGNGMTGYDREFVIFLSEVWAEAHWDDAHIQLPEWSDYVPDFCLMNGRVYPDTLLPNWSRDPLTGGYTTTGGRDDLKYQPTSSLVQANRNERVLLRFINLGYTRQSMTLGGMHMRVVAKDATLLRGRDGTDLSYRTNTVAIGPGESVDAIVTTPNVSTQSTYLLYNRDFNRTSNAGASGYGGQMTEIRVFPGTLGPQSEPNT